MAAESPIFLLSGAQTRYGDTDTLEIQLIEPITPASLMKIGSTQAAEIQIGKVGESTKIMGDLTVVGSSTLQANATITGTIDLGDGDDDIINIGGGDTGPGSADVVNLNNNLTLGAIGGTQVSLGSGVLDYASEIWLDSAEGANSSNVSPKSAYDLSFSGLDAGAYAVGINPDLLTNISIPAGTEDLMTVLDLMDAAIGAAAGSTTLQQAYVAGSDITQTFADQGMTVDRGLNVEAAPMYQLIDSSTVAQDVLSISKTGAGAGDGLEISMGATTTGRGIRVVAAGSGTGVLVTDGAVDQTGISPGLIFQSSGNDLDVAILPGAGTAGNFSATAGKSTSVSTPGGTSSLIGGDGSDTGTSTGGPVKMLGGAGGLIGGGGGALELLAGAATTLGTGGNIDLFAGEGAGVGAGGATTIEGGYSDDGVGGAVRIEAGGSAAAAGGAVTILGGESEDLAGGAVNITGGDSGAATGADVIIAGGASNTAGFDGGAVRITGGTSTSLEAGGVVIRGGFDATFANQGLVSVGTSQSSAVEVGLQGLTNTGIPVKLSGATVLGSPAAATRSANDLNDKTSQVTAGANVVGVNTSTLTNAAMIAANGDLQTQLETIGAQIGAGASDTLDSVMAQGATSDNQLTIPMSEAAGPVVWSDGTSTEIDAMVTLNRAGDGTTAVGNGRVLDINYTAAGNVTGALAVTSTGTGSDAVAALIHSTGANSDGLSIYRQPGTAVGLGGNALSVSGDSFASAGSNSLVQIGENGGVPKIDFDHRDFTVTSDIASTYAFSATAQPTAATRGVGFSMTAGTGNGDDGGDLTLSAGLAGAASDGGTTLISGGDGVGVGSGGELILNAGDAPGAGSDGAIRIGASSSNFVQIGGVSHGIVTYLYGNETAPTLRAQATPLTLDTDGATVLTMSVLVVDGDPNTNTDVSAQSGSIALDDTGKLWINTSGGGVGTTWSEANQGSAIVPSLDAVITTGTIDNGVTVPGTVTFSDGGNAIAGGVFVVEKSSTSGSPGFWAKGDVSTTGNVMQASITAGNVFAVGPTGTVTQGIDGGATTTSVKAEFGSDLSLQAAAGKAINVNTENVAGTTTLGTTIDASIPIVYQVAYSSGSGVITAVDEIGTAGMDRRSTTTTGGGLDMNFTTEVLGIGDAGDMNLAVLNAGTGTSGGLTITVGKAGVTTGIDESMVVETVLDVVFRARSGADLTINQSGVEDLVGFTVPVTSIVGALNELKAEAASFPTVTVTVGAVALVAGELLSMGTGSTVAKADADVAAPTRYPIGFATAVAGIGVSTEMQIAGELTIPSAVWTGGTPGATDGGKRVYMSTTPGKVTLTSPTSAARSQRVGIVSFADAGAETTRIVIQFGEGVDLP